MSFRRRVWSYPWFVWGAMLLVAASGLGAVVHRLMQPKVEAEEPLTVYAPQGSLMAVEAPDFAGVLAAWTNSAEEKAWAKSDNYAVFSKSRLFSRLCEAQSEFAASAGLAPDAQFLKQVAGEDSLFAWYDIGKLEFLYVTRMRPGDAANSSLMQLKDKFQMRRVGADSFYIRAQAAQAIDQDAPEAGTGAARTVGFAVHGDLLLLATREDLIANALLLAQHQGDANLKNEQWYATAVSAVGTRKGDAKPDMRMTLNLAKIVPSPYFRSYWVQRNVTEMKQYSAVVSDLYRSADAIREERVLIPRVTDAAVAAEDLGPILKYLPTDAGVYRAMARPETATVVEELDRRLVSRGAAAYRDLRVAPLADLSDVSAGGSGDLDTRIDEQPVPQEPMERSLDGLQSLVEAMHPEAMLVYSTGGAGGADAVFRTPHTAVVISGGNAWDSGQAQSALVAALRERLTIGGAGMSWQAHEQGGERWMELSGLQPLAMAVLGGDLVVASDRETMLQVLGSSKRDNRIGGEYAKVRSVAGFNHTAERAEYLRLTTLLDHDHVPEGGHGSTVTGAPAFFSKDLGGLSQTFKDLDSERVVEGAGANGIVRQTVIYRWGR